MKTGKLKTVYPVAYQETLSFLVVMSLHSGTGPYANSEEVNRNVSHDPHLSLGQILKQKRTQQAGGSVSEGSKFAKINLRLNIANDPIEPAQVKMNMNMNMNMNSQGHVSCGILLFNQNGALLTLIRPHSYAFASIFVTLVSPPENRTIKTYTEMFRELTDEEYTIMKEHWTMDGLDYVIDKYLSMIAPQLREIKDQTQRKFEVNYKKMKFEWKQVVEKIQIDEIQKDRSARIHDFPKGRKPQDGSKTREDIIRQKFKQETLHDIPQDIVYGPWIKVGYESSDGAWYNFELLSAKCKSFDLSSTSTKWILPDDLKVIGEVRKAIKDAWAPIAEK